LANVIVTRYDLDDQAKCEELIEKALDDMGVGEPDMEHSAELRVAAKEYYMRLVQNYLDYSDEVIFNEHFTDQQAYVLGFVTGYEACLKTHCS